MATGKRKQKNAVSKIKGTDGRKNNKRLPSKVKTKEIAKKKSEMTPAQMNAAKKRMVSTYAIKAIKKSFGSEAEAWEALAEQAKDSFAHLNLMWQYAYGKPGENNEANVNTRSKAPIINFNVNNNDNNTIDIDVEEIDDTEEEE